MKFPKKLTVLQMCFLALAAVLNIAGANIALLLRIPLYLDTLGTFLSAMLFGPFYGMIPGLLSGLLTGFTTDIYSLFYLPVQLVTALAAGFLFYEKSFKTGKYLILLYAVAVTVPGTIVSASITAFLFGGITSSGSSILVQLLHHTGLNLTASVFCVQLLTDYLDRTVMLCLSVLVLGVLPTSMLAVLKKGQRNYGSL
ncbi:ECF transporter S component [Sellimonas catena]|uniref:Membrane protein n=1 Tax=Sellimonas catena TaxID=2994035 RepID=A0A9W6C634_9FIRM|nr:ECF transporter S component [Sellimonas catena]GLG03330.1 membrane protein [Sellimonas catena]GLG90562.1 membrane protein [Sellimonas catena]